MTELPKISIITPSFNQVEFLEETILSVLNQNYPYLEYIVIDGGSTDGSIDIIRKYERYFTYWISERDHGQTDAINKGFKRATGEILCWLNSDDIHCPWTLKVVASIFRDCHDIEWLTSARHLIMTESGIVKYMGQSDGYTQRRFYSGRHLNDPAAGMIQQEATFWRASLWKKAGEGLNTNFCNALDWELWARFWQYSRMVSVDVPLSVFRIYPRQKTSSNFELSKQESLQLLRRYGSARWSPWRVKLAKRIARAWPRASRYLGEDSLFVWWDDATSQWKLGCRSAI